MQGWYTKEGRLADERSKSPIVTRPLSLSFSLRLIYSSILSPSLRPQRPFSPHPSRPKLGEILIPRIIGDRLAWLFLGLENLSLVKIEIGKFFLTGELVIVELF